MKGDRNYLFHDEKGGGYPGDLKGWFFGWQQTWQQIRRRFSVILRFKPFARSLSPFFCFVCFGLFPFFIFHIYFFVL